MSCVRYAAFAHKVVTKLASAKPGERVAVISDTAADEDMASALMGAAISAGTEPCLVLYPEARDINIEPSAQVGAALGASDLLIDLSTKYIIHTGVYRAARNNGARALVTIAGGSEDYLVRGVVHVDYDTMGAEGERIRDLFSRGRRVRVTTPSGTDLSFDLGDRKGVLRDGRVTVPGEIDYFPGAQVSVGPIEDSVEGRLMLDGSVYPPLGRLTQPFTAEMRGGRLGHVSGSPEAEAWWKWLTAFKEPNMLRPAHFSIGLNPVAQLRGFIIEDERVRGSVTFGFGSQMAEFGGTIGPAPSHTDAVLLGATVKIDDVTVVDHGCLV